jgi:hypothetical protein
LRAQVRTSSRQHDNATGLRPVANEFEATELNIDRTTLQFVAGT